MPVVQNEWGGGCRFSLELAETHFYSGEVNPTGIQSLGRWVEVICWETPRGRGDSSKEDGNLKPRESCITSPVLNIPK